MKWEKVKLREVTTIVGGYAFKSSNMKDECLPNYRPVVKIGNVSASGTLDLSSVQYHEFSRDLEQYSINNGDVLIAMTGATVGKVSVSTYNDLLLNQRVGLIRPKKELISHRFLHHSICNPHFYEYCQFTAGGGAQGNISPSQILDYQIPLPPLHIQEQIADTLDKADALHRKDQELLQKYDQLAQAIFYDMFGDPVRNDKGWSKKQLGEVVLKITDGEHINPRFTSSGYPMVTAKNVLDDVINFDNTQFVSETDFSKFYKKCNPERGDLLMVSRGATIGRNCIVKSDTKFVLMGSVILIKPSHLIETQFLKTLFSLNDVRKKLYTVSSASAQQAIYISHLNKFQIPLPPVGLQKEFVHRINLINGQVGFNSAKKSDMLLIQQMQSYF